MKKTIIYLILIIIANYLVLNSWFTQHNHNNHNSFIDTVGFLVGLFSIFQFAVNFAGLFTKREFSYSILLSDDAKDDDTLNKPASILAITLFLVIGLHIWGYIEFSKYQTNLLSKDGILTKAITTSKKLESRGKNKRARYYIYYNFEHDGKVYMHSQPNDTIEVGDTIVVKILPKNPSNHLIIKKQDLQ